MIAFTEIVKMKMNAVAEKRTDEASSSPTCRSNNDGSIEAYHLLLVMYYSQFNLTTPPTNFLMGLLGELRHRKR
jgi:hypothetical protein